MYILIMLLALHTTPTPPPSDPIEADLIRCEETGTKVRCTWRKRS